MTASLGIRVIRSSLVDWRSMKKECRHARHNSVLYTHTPIPYIYYQSRETQLPALPLTLVKYGVTCRSPQFIWVHVYSCIHWLRPRNPSPLLPPHLDSYARALLVSQDRRQLCETTRLHTCLHSPLPLSSLCGIEKQRMRLGLDTLLHVKGRHGFLS